MAKVSRSDILDYQTYEERRDEIRKRVLEIKKVRRIHVGEYLTFLFENAETVRYQIQEMMRVEKIVKERDIEHEITTYNELVGDPGEVGCTLLIEIEDPDRRLDLLRAWADLPSHLYVRVADGTRVRPTFDPRQVADDGKLSSVQYLRFEVGSGEPVAVGADLPELTGETVLDDAQRVALSQDVGA